MKLQLPTTRVGDQALIVRQPPYVWRCHYDDCGFVVVTRLKDVMPQMVADHLIAVHYREEGAS